MKIEITPAIRNAGNRHNITCSRAYHFERSREASIAVLNTGLFIGKKNTPRNKPQSIAGFSTLFSVP
jgi:hypothetical protein